MESCTKCGKPLPEDANFCPHCGVPQHQAAFERFDTYARRYLSDELSKNSSKRSTFRRDSTLLSRLSYLTGWIGMVIGFSLLPNYSGIIVILGGILILPPIRSIIETRLNRRIGIAHTMGTSIGLIGLGIALFFVA